jgi:transposase
VDEPGFHPTTLVKFRDRLIRYGLERVGFEGVLQAMREAGYLPKKTRQRLDSSHVIGLVSHMSRLECVRETVRLALEALAKIESLARPDTWPVWWERYVESKLDYQTGAACNLKRWCRRQVWELRWVTNPMGYKTTMIVPA